MSTKNLENCVTNSKKEEPKVDQASVPNFIEFRRLRAANNEKFKVTRTEISFDKKTSGIYLDDIREMLAKMQPFDRNIAVRFFEDAQNITIRIYPCSLNETSFMRVQNEDDADNGISFGRDIHMFGHLPPAYELLEDKSALDGQHFIEKFWMPIRKKYNKNVVLTYSRNTDSQGGSIDIQLIIDARCKEVKRNLDGAAWDLMEALRKITADADVSEMPAARTVDQVSMFIAEHISMLSSRTMLEGYLSLRK